MAVVDEMRHKFVEGFGYIVEMMQKKEEFINYDDPDSIETVATAIKNISNAILSLNRDYRDLLDDHDKVKIVIDQAQEFETL